MRADRKSCAALIPLLACLLGSGGGGDISVQAAHYRVPVPSNLEPWATYPVDSVKVELKDHGALKIEYDFPDWLVGDNQKVKLTGSGQPGSPSIHVHAGGLGDGDCTVTSTHIECQEHLPGMPVDRAGAEDAMMQAGLSDDEIDQRLDVTDCFSVDPIGILELDLQ